MINEDLVIVGPVPIKYNLKYVTDRYDTIVCGNTAKFMEPKYAIVNSETRLQDMLNSPSYKQSDILTTQELYKKYIFFDQVDFLPSFPGEKVVSKPHAVSEQSLALMFACWLEKKTVYLFGYDIEDLSERADLLNLGACYPHSDIVYVRKPNPTKIFLFDAIDNMRVMDYNEFDKL